MDGQRLRCRVDDPVVRDPGARVEGKLLDEVRSSIARREDLADPVRSSADRPPRGTLGHTLAPPAREVRANQVVQRELDVDLGEDPPSTRAIRTAGTTVEGRTDERREHLERGVAQREQRFGRCERLGGGGHDMTLALLREVADRATV